MARAMPHSTSREMARVGGLRFSVRSRPSTEGDAEQWHTGTATHARTPIFVTRPLAIALHFNPNRGWILMGVGETEGDRARRVPPQGRAVIDERAVAIVAEVCRRLFYATNQSAPDVDEIRIYPDGSVAPPSGPTVHTPENRWSHSPTCLTPSSPHSEATNRVTRSGRPYECSRLEPEAERDFH